jgi:hypothetical protein
MALNEDLSVFLADFGVSCTSGSITALGILDQPGQILADGMVITTDYQLTAKANDFGGLLYGDAITVDGTYYQVRETRKIDDGALVEIFLSKLAPDATAVGRNPRAFGLADLADVDVSYVQAEYVVADYAGAQAGDLLVYDGTKWVDGQDDNGTAVAVALD